MPRNTLKKSEGKPSLQIVSPHAAAVPVIQQAPTMGKVFAESMTSGVGFGLGSAFVRQLFGSSQTTVGESQISNEYSECVEANKHNKTDNVCYHLSNQYKSCMIRTNFNENECKRDL